MRPASNNARRARPLLGTFVEIAASGAPRAMLDAAIDAAFDAVALVHRLMSPRERDSDVSRLNRGAAAKVVVVHPWTYRVLEVALDLERRSAGAFDITAQARSPRRPDAGASIKLAPGSRARFFKADARVDLGGIAKGFAVDRALEVLAARGVPQAIVNAGGDLAVMGDAAETVQLRDPRDPRRLLCTLAVRDQALASSGAVIDPAGGAIAPASAVVDPRSGAMLSRAATVRAPSCMMADALAKIVMVAGEAALPLLRRERASALLMAEDGALIVTDDWPDAVCSAA
ncbi:MAG TPA: FAD:protein FMN transferase [Stellaceae bacterium]|nr:FAD:protein FMN transferase [Stellaceae bacterium]